MFPSVSVNKDDFSHCENVVSHVIDILLNAAM